MGRSRKQPIPTGIPALVFLPTDNYIVVNGKRYRVLHMQYDLKGEYMPLATLRP